MLLTLDNDLSMFLYNEKFDIECVLSVIHKNYTPSGSDILYIHTLTNIWLNVPQQVVYLPGSFVHKSVQTCPKITCGHLFTS